MDWLSAFWAGLAGGVVMGIWAMMMNMVGFSQMSMANYEGCMITGNTEGTGTFAAGMVMHLVLSVLIAFVYAFAFETIWGNATWLSGLVFGAVHWIIAGLVLPMMDSMSTCVKRNAMTPLRMFASGYGSDAVITFLVGHLLYGAVVGWLYTVQGT